MRLYITLWTRDRAGRIAPQVIAHAGSIPGARRMARAEARSRFGDPLFIKDQTLAGGKWQERAEDGETAGECITIENATEDTQ